MCVCVLCLYMCECWCVMWVCTRVCVFVCVWVPGCTCTCGWIGDWVCVCVCVHARLCVWQARMVLEREFNNLLARGTDRRLEEVSIHSTCPHTCNSPYHYATPVPTPPRPGSPPVLSAGTCILVISTCPLHPQSSVLYLFALPSSLPPHLFFIP